MILLKKMLATLVRTFYLCTHVWANLNHTSLSKPFYVAVETNLDSKLHWISSNDFFVLYIRIINCLFASY